MAVSRTSAWGFFRSVVAPVLVAFMVTVGSVAAFVALSISRTDTDALDNQTTLLRLAVDERIIGATRGQLDLAVWDAPLEAYAQGDIKWFATHFGSDGYEYYAQHRVYVLNPDLTPFFAMRDGGAVPPSAFEAVRAEFTPLIDQLATLDKQAGIAAYKADNRDKPPIITELAIIEGHPAIVSVAPLVSDTRTLNAAPGMEPIYIAVTILDATIAKELSDQYLLHGARFDDNGNVKSGEAALPLHNAAGEPAAWLKWLPDHPGERILRETRPALGVALLVSVSIIGLLLRSLRHTGDQLHAERVDAQHRALHDPLTGLGNRAMFRDRLEQAFRSMPRSAPCVALLALDLDRFKQVNDTMGHEAGDELLRQVATRINAILRPTDTLVRLGGDEFAIIQTAISDASDSAALASRILSAIRAPYHIADRTLEIGVSIGIVTAPDNARTENELVTRADSALYRAKAGGRHRYCFYTRNNDRDGQQDLEHRVQHALGKRGIA